MITEHFEVLIKQTLLLDMSMTSFSTGISWTCTFAIAKFCLWTRGQSNKKFGTFYEYPNSQ